MGEPSVRIRRFGRYLLGRRIGSGGMAAVFAALDESAGGRLVAVKIMSTALWGDERSQALFVREARIASRLDHPNVARVFDVGDISGEAYLAMDLLWGASLGRILGEARAPMPIDVALGVVLDALDALAAAHELRDDAGASLGLVHQDVSPPNLFVGYDGATRLLDFGVARLGAVDASRTDSLRGKAGYFAPEQLTGAKIGPRADLFSLAVVLHECLAGQRLFAHATEAESIAAVVNGTAPDVRTARPDVPEPIATVLARALRKNPSDRFPRAATMRVELEAAARRAGLAAAPPAAIAAYARAVAPPLFDLAELEREIRAGAPAEAVDVADLPTYTGPDDPAGAATQPVATTPAAGSPLAAAARIDSSSASPPLRARATSVGRAQPARRRIHPAILVAMGLLVGLLGALAWSRIWGPVRWGAPGAASSAR